MRKRQEAVTVLLRSSDPREVRERYKTAERVHSPRSRVFVRLTKAGGVAVVLCTDVASTIRWRPDIRLLTLSEYEADLLKNTGTCEHIP